MSLAPLINYRAMVAEDDEGLAWFLEDLDAINRVLEDNGLPRHEEPAEVLDYTIRVEMNHLGTTWLHHLRRLQAHVLQDPAWKHTPVTDDDEPWKDEAIDRELCVYMRSQLIQHADTEGFYVPIDFEEVLYDAPGEMLGSSQRLLAELRQLAPYLGVTLDEHGALSDAEAWRVARTTDEDPAFREKLAWLLLFECARTSVEHETLLAFR
ncbi:MAG: hypothetical protein JNL83_16095 [Myxococcales bacterium]|nr:hypothetical protein [Myxococcales bacterium]